MPATLPTGSSSSMRPLSSLLPSGETRPQGERIGRFAIVRRLGQGAQGEVFLAQDTRLERSVALKTLSLGAAAPPQRAELVRRLLDEARLVAALQHPNLVALYDAGEENGAPYLVFEYVPGNTLAALLREQGSLATTQAVMIALGALRGVAYAHAQGVLHRDLKAGNVMLTAEGIARVTDFGIACRLAANAADPGTPVGTPSYMAPESINDGTYLPASDVYSIGTLLYEMLTGAPPARAASVEETLSRALRGDFAPPSHANPQVDARLDALIMKALSTDPTARYASAADMADALEAYLAPEPAAPAPDGTRGTLHFLLRRMRHQSDFPALTETITAINRIASSELEPASAMCNAILKDVSLTGKVLRLVNAAHYREFGGTVSTVSRALSILGFDGVRNVAASLLLFEHLRNRAQASALGEELVASLFSALLARELVQRLGVRNAEEAFICAMFHRLGRLLVCFYLPEEQAAIERLAHSRSWSDARAARDVLGIDYAELGAGVARSWNFPTRIVDSMRPVETMITTRSAFETDRLRVLAGLANALCDAARNTSDTARAAQVQALVRKFGKGTGVSERVLDAALHASLEELARDAPALGLGRGDSALLRQACARGTARDTEEKTVVLPARVPDTADTPATAPPVERHAVLAAGVQDITDALLGEYELNDVLRIILETMYRGIGFGRVILCVRDIGRNVLRARFGLGEDVDAIISAGFAIPLEGPSKDVFHCAVHEGVDACVEDLEAESVRGQVPQWYRNAIRARAMALFPIRVNGKAVALIYGDTDNPAVIQLRPEELSLLKTLRNQAVLAIRQHG